MPNLKKQLIRLGAQKPNLRPHIRPVLDKILGTGVQASAFRKWEDVVRALGAEVALNNFIQYVGGNEARANFEHIARMHDLPIEVSRRKDLAQEFAQQLGWDTLANEFAQASSKRLLEEAVDDIMHMYGI